MDVINRAALGSSASVGDLYDARTDRLCGYSMFTKQPPESCITIYDAPYSEVHVVHEDSYSEKFTKMDINAELSVSVLSGLFNLEGSGHYLTDKKSSARSVRSSLIYNIKTKDEFLNIYHEDLKDCFSMDALEGGLATHVVVEILWGANTIVTSKFENTENLDSQEIEGKLSAAMTVFTAKIKGGADAEIKDGDIDKSLKFEIQLFGDVLAPNEVLPTTFEGSLDLMKKMPSLVATSNDGKGKPLTYRLIPIGLIGKYLKLTISTDLILKTMEETSLLRVVQFFDQIAAVEQKLNDFYRDMLAFQYCVEPDDFEKVEALMNEVAVKQTLPKTMLATTLQDVRSGKADATALDELLVKFQSNEVSPGKVSTILNDWKKLAEKINFARILKNKNVQYIGLGESFETEVMENFKTKCIVLFFCQDSPTQDAPSWAENKRLFLGNLERNKDKYEYFAVDCDLQPDLAIPNTTSCVQVIEKGQIVIANLLLEKEPAVTWKKAFSGLVPDGAVLGGHDGPAPLYVARAYHNGDLIPGQLHSVQKTMSVTYGGFELKKTEYEVLCDVEVTWVAAEDGEIPPGALKGGFCNASTTKEDLYIGRATEYNRSYLGKIQPRLGVGYFPIMDHEVSEQKYEVLVPSWSNNVWRD